MLEIVFAIYLIMTAALVVSATMPIANVSRAEASIQDRAMGLAQKQLESIRGAGYANANASQLVSMGLIDSTNEVGPNTYTFTNVDSAVLDNPALVLPKGSGTVDLQQIDIDMVQVVVTVTWNDRGTVKSFTTGTLIANL